MAQPRFSADRLGFDCLVALTAAGVQTGNFVRVNAYDPLRPEALVLLGTVALFWIALACVCRALKAPAVFYALLVAGQLDMATGFMGWVRDRGIGWGFGPAGGKLLALAAGGLILSGAFAVRKALPKLVMAAFVTAFVSGWVVDSMTPRKLFTDASAVAASAALPPADLPNILFVIVDEHAAFGAFPAAVAAEHGKFEPQIAALREKGFDVYTHATSHYSSTWDSIPSYLNAEARIDRRREHLSKKSLIKNGLFESWKEKGYRIRVYQSSHLDYCRAPGVPADRCFTYEESSAGYLQSTSLSWPQRFRVLAGAWVGAQKSRVLHKIYDRCVSAPNFRNVMTGALAADRVLGEVEKDLTAHPRGTAFFVHLMLPHSSYVYASDCRIKDPASWLLSVEDFHEVSGVVNTPASRDLKYREYADQVVCAQSKLDGLWAWMRSQGLWEQAQVVLASDHGSRIYERSPLEKNLTKLTCADLQDAYWAFLAIKPSGSGAGGQEVTERVASAGKIAQELEIGPPTLWENLQPGQVLLQSERPQSFAAVDYIDCAS